MEHELLRVVGSVAGIGGIALGVLLLVFRSVIQEKIFPKLTRKQAFTVIVLLLILTWLVALAGIAAWVFTTANWDQQETRSTREDRDAFEERIFAELQRTRPLDASFDPSIDKNLTKAVERMARSAERGELGVGRPLEKLGPADIPVWLDAERQKLDLNQKGLNAEINAAKIALDREIAAVAYATGQIDRAESALNRILDALPNDVEATSQLGRIQYQRRDFDGAEANFKRVLDLSGDDESWQATAYGDLGAVMLARNKFDEAERFFRQGIRVDERLDRHNGLASHYGNLGVLRQRQATLADDDENAARLFLEAERMLLIALGLEDRPLHKSNHLTNLGHVLQRTDRFDEAADVYAQALEIHEQLGRLQGIAAVSGGLARVMRIRAANQSDPIEKLKLFAKAEKHGQRALEINQTLESPHDVAISKSGLADIAAAAGDVERAITLWSEARDTFVKLGEDRFAEIMQRTIDNVAE